VNNFRRDIMDNVLERIDYLLRNIEEMDVIKENMIINESYNHVQDYLTESTIKLEELAEAFASKFDKQMYTILKRTYGEYNLNLIQSIDADPSRNIVTLGFGEALVSELLKFGNRPSEVNELLRVIIGLISSIHNVEIDADMNNRIICVNFKIDANTILSDIKTSINGLKKSIRDDRKKLFKEFINIKNLVIYPKYRKIMISGLRDEIVRRESLVRECNNVITEEFISNFLSVYRKEIIRYAEYLEKSLDAYYEHDFCVQY
jgi:hypothetical protein